MCSGTFEARETGIRESKTSLPDTLVKTALKPDRRQHRIANWTGIKCTYPAHCGYDSIT